MGLLELICLVPTALLPTVRLLIVVPAIVPPVIATLFAAWVAIVPKPRDVLAVAPVSATQLDPLPTIKLPLVTAKPAISVSPASKA